MKYKLKETPIDIHSETFLEDYFRNQGISKLESFLRAPQDEDQESPFGLSYIYEGLEMLRKHVSRGSTIFLQVDSDTDGYTSSAMIYSFLKTLNPALEIHWAIHPNKEHGMVPDIVPFDVDLVIVPDAGSNQIEESEELAQRCDVLIIDHHIADVDISSEKVVVINNQTSPFFNNKNSSGAGIVYKFLEAYCKKYELGDLYKDYIDLAAVGIVADMMDSRQLDNNYIITKGLQNINNKMLKALIEKRAYSISSVDSPTKIDIAFYIAPIINGLIRFGTQEEKEDLFIGLSDNSIEGSTIHVFGKKETEEDYYQRTARKSANVKSRQDNVVNKLVPIIQEKIKREGLDKHKIIIYKTSKTNPDELPSTLTGLVAMKLVAFYKKPVLVLRPVFQGKEVSFRGSGRSLAADGFDSFKDYLWETGLVEYSSGHNLAFGTGIKEELIPALLEHADAHLANIDFGSRTKEVDFIFEQGQINAKVLRSFANLKHLYGNGISEPLFVFKLFVTENNFQGMGRNKATLKIVSGGMTFIKFFAADVVEELEALVTYGPANVEVLGRAGLNEYNGNTTLQVIIEEIKMEPIVEEVLF